MLELNKIYLQDCIEGMKKIESESVDLTIADPPYFKVIGESWDYQWRTAEKYLNWSREYLKEIYRVTRKGGSFYLFGYFRMLVHLVPLIEELGFELRQQIIIDKGMRAVSGRATKNYRMFPNVTESVVFFVKDSKPFIKDILLERQKELGLKAKEINEGLGVKSNGGGMWSIYTGNNICKQVPTEENWLKLDEILSHGIPYDKISQTYNAQLGFTDVWSDIDFYKEKRYHPTQKPISLIDRIVLASSNEGDIVLDPFMGGGSTAISAIKNSRNYIGFEIEEKYFEKSIKRIDEFNLED